MAVATFGKRVQRGAITNANWRDKCKVRTPMQDCGINVKCEHQCKQQLTEMATDEDVCCFCFVVSVFVAFGVRTKQLCSCFVAFVFAVVASVFDAVVFARSLARSLSPFLFQLDHNEVRVQTQTTA